ncbi:AbrB/MazE/SpoVT family DNA-binding domain-containing protein [Cyanobacteria bacterium FACHB-DQ100]|uniref:AbrB/MazE/SpoVT family DNA-binding domain-containing protein n=1 Tax=Leptolyngbya sp. DQ-M1 TaxID=2933920 RepID=UPI0019C4194C|nr:AbrB/MazE/SpoVT family DNA-binding domain-containing protein [Cyanobacteria bacterium FACHB-DQ100]
MDNLKIEKVGDSLGVALPEEIVQKLQVKEGDTVDISETPDGVEITNRAPNLEKAMQAYQKINEKYKNALRELSK